MDEQIVSKEATLILNA